MKKIAVIRQKGSYPGKILLFLGFLAGMLIPNLGYRFMWKQQAFSSLYTLGLMGKSTNLGMEYLWQIIRMRGGIFLFLLLCGFTVFGVPLAVVTMLEMGIELGMVIVLSILEFGAAGGLVALALLFPQYLIYIPVFFKVLPLVYIESLEIWKNHGIFPSKAGNYLGKSLLYALYYSAGILLEWYLNPWITEKILELVNFF